MLNLAQLLQRLTPPAPQGGRVVRLLGEAESDIPACPGCGFKGGEADYYWKKKADGTVRRYRLCKRCHNEQLKHPKGSRRAAP